MKSAFSRYQKKAYPIRYEGTLIVHTLVGGTPTDPNVAKAWIESKLDSSDDIIRDQVAEIMADRGVGKDEAAEILKMNKHLNGFKRDSNGLYIEGRQLKAAMKEAASVAVAAGKLDARGWGKTNKGLKSWLAEHIIVLEDKLYLGVNEPTGVMQRFIATFRGTGIQYEEFVEDAKINFTVTTDQDFTAEQWAMLWLTGERQGLGSSRSQGFGTYTVTSWNKVS